MAVSRLGVPTCPKGLEHPVLPRAATPKLCKQALYGEPHSTQPADLTRMFPEPVKTRSLR